MKRVQLPSVAFLLLIIFVTLTLITQAGCVFAQTKQKAADDNSPEALTREAEQLMREGDGLKRAGRTKEANEKYTAAVQKNKAAAEAYERLADAQITGQQSPPPNRIPAHETTPAPAKIAPPAEAPPPNAPPVQQDAAPVQGGEGFPANKRLEGTWRAMASGVGFSTSRAYTFHADGTYEFAGGASVSGGIHGAGAAGNKGQYQIKGKQLILTSGGTQQTLKIETYLENGYQKANPWRIEIDGTTFKNTSGDT